MNIKFIYSLFVTVLIAVIPESCFADATRIERREILQGNSYYRESNFKKAEESFKKALADNPNSLEAKYNLGLAIVRQISNPKDTTDVTLKLIEGAKSEWIQVAAVASTNPGLAEKANYNLGNLAFHQEDYSSAIQFYKQALRLDPNDDHARKNLRIAQLKIQDNKKDKNQQNQDQNKDQNNKDQNKQNQDKQDQDKQDQNKDQNKDQNQNKQQPQQDKKNDNSSRMNDQTANQILQAADNKENQVRARLMKGGNQKGDKQGSGRSNYRRW